MKSAYDLDANDRLDDDERGLLLADLTSRCERLQARWVQLHDTSHDGWLDTTEHPHAVAALGVRREERIVAQLRGAAGPSLGGTAAQLRAALRHGHDLPR